jgi:hypothetical protein
MAAWSEVRGARLEALESVITDTRVAAADVDQPGGRRYVHE